MILSQFETLESPHCIFTAIGLGVVGLCLLKTVLRLGRFYKGHFTGPAVNFRDLGKYAVVTGATDGIGKAYAFELAGYGMDIVLVSRTLSRLQDTAAELKRKYPKTDVKTIVVDYERTDVYDYLERELDGIDVGVLVNNVGAAITPLKLLTEMPREDVFRMINLNIVSVVLTSHVVLPKMAAKRRGAVLNISSASALFPPLFLMYATCKAFIRRFSYGLRLQYSPLGILVQDVEPFFVTTKLAHNIKGLFVISPEQCAKQSLMTVGHYDETNGAALHDFQGFIVSLLPDFIFCRLLAMSNKKQKEEVERNEKLKKSK